MRDRNMKINENGRADIDRITDETIRAAVREGAVETPAGLHDAVMAKVREEKIKKTRIDGRRLRRIAGAAAAAIALFVCVGVAAAIGTRSGKGGSIDMAAPGAEVMDQAGANAPAGSYEKPTDRNDADVPSDDGDGADVPDESRDMPTGGNNTDESWELTVSALEYARGNGYDGAYVVVTDADGIALAADALGIAAKSDGNADIIIAEYSAEALETVENAVGRDSELLGAENGSLCIVVIAEK